jgi:hypothetical protein
MSTASPHTAESVATWLRTLPHTNATPVLVKIGRRLYVGAIYDQRREHHPGTRAYAEGRRHYYQSGIYLLGRLPASYLRTSRIAYRFQDGSRRYYVAGWYDRDEPNDFHPFGRMFQLFPDRENVTDGYPEMRAEMRW